MDGFFGVLVGWERVVFAGDVEIKLGDPEVRVGAGYDEYFWRGAESGEVQEICVEFVEEGVGDEVHWWIGDSWSECLIVAVDAINAECGVSFVHCD